ncbi:MAG: RHS repeat-associated core domain-containing protein [Desulfobacterales bacterium]
MPKKTIHIIRICSWRSPDSHCGHRKQPAFSGQYYDRETDCITIGNAIEDLDTGRYLTPDPIGLEGGLNLYAYVDGIR